MFQFPAFASLSGYHASCMVGSPIRTSADPWVFAPPRGFSQLVTSFFASESLGIPRTLLLDFLVSRVSIVKDSLRLILVSTLARLSAGLLLYVSCPNMSKTSRGPLRTATRTPAGLPAATRPTYVRTREIARLARGSSLRPLVFCAVLHGSRKEVFQPHLPVRLPCYDLAPITRFTLGRSSRARTSGTPDFHGLTGGVYKARERIHRAMADARLLANPTSRSRVADSDPN